MYGCPAFSIWGIVPAHTEYDTEFIFYTRLEYSVCTGSIIFYSFGLPDVIIVLVYRETVQLLKKDHHAVTEYVNPVFVSG